MWGAFFIVSTLAVLSAQAQDVPANSFRNGLMNYFDHGYFTSEFQSLLRSLNLKHAFRSDAGPFLDLNPDLVCLMCDAVLDVVLDDIRGGLITRDELIEVVTELCLQVIFESREVCEGTIISNIDLVWHIAIANPDRRADTMCGIVGQSFGCTGTPDEWSINIPEGSSELNKGIISDEDPIRVLHLTDIHYDPFYDPGSLANCNEPVCCTVDTVAEFPEDEAGFWGDYRDCDSPLHAIDDALQHIAAQHLDIDYIYYTGDTVSHRVWKTSFDANTADIILINDRLAQAFPNIPIYPILGNHEPHPLNVFAPLEIEDENLSTQWLFDLSADLWGEWLGEEAKETIRKGGYYTVLVREGFRIIALNSNVGYTMNLWLLYDDVDPYGQLQWLADTLYEAEQNGEKVHIISHVPSSDSTTYAVWSREYRRVIDRFAGTIAATFNGHSHVDELILYHSLEDPSLPIGIAWNGGSLTTYSHKNPNYKVFEVDVESYEVVDYEVWAYNITFANLTPDLEPEWFRLYTFKDAYGLNGAAPVDVRELAEKMVDDRSLIEQYFRFSVRYADTSLASGCDSYCLRNLVCNMVRSEFSDNTQCDELTSDW